MVKKRRPSLLAKAKDIPKAGYRRSTGVEDWFSRLQISHPKIASEVLEVGKDWIAGGEIRMIFSRRTELHRFLIDSVPEIHGLKYQAFRVWLKSQADV